MRKRIYKICAMLVLAILVCVSATPAFANLTSQSGEIKVYLHSIETKEPIANAQINLYKVADYDGRDVVLVNGFEASGITKDVLIEHNNEIAQLLDAYIASHTVAGPYRYGVSGVDGWITFADVPPGIYYARYDGDNDNGHRKIHMTSFIAPLPFLNGDVTEWALDCRPKCEEIECTDVTVMKIWIDDSHSSLRPQHVEIELYQDNRMIDAVQITADDNWMYTWTDLPASYTYSIREHNVPGSYTSRIYELEKNTFKIENTYSTTYIPATGDEANVPLYISGVCCGVLIMVFIVIVLIIQRKRSKANEA